MNGKPSRECDFWKEIIEKMVPLFQISLLVVRSREAGRKVPGHLQTSPSHSRNHYPLTAGQGGATSSKVSQEKERAKAWAKMNPRVWIWLPEDSGRMAGVTLKLHDPRLPSEWRNSKAYMRQAAQGRDTLIYISNLLSLSSWHHICHCGFLDYSRLWIPESIFPDELVWILFLALVSFSHFLSASLLKTVAGVFVVSQTPKCTGAFSRLQSLWPFSLPITQMISNCLALLLLDIYSPALPPLIFFTVFRARPTWSHHNCSFKLKEFDKWSWVGSWQAICLNKLQWPSVDQSPYPLIIGTYSSSVCFVKLFLCLTLFIFQLYTIIPKSSKLTMRESNL